MRKQAATLERKAYRPPEVAKITGLSRAFIYQLIKEDRLRAVRIGRALVVPGPAVDELLAGDSQAVAGGE